MKRPIASLSAALFCGFLALSAPANASVLGLASDFNSFTFGSATYTQLTMKGRVAAGGSVGFVSTAPGSGLTADSTRFDVVSGGSVSINGASLMGSVSAAGASSMIGVGFKPGAGVVTQPSPVNFITALAELTDLSEDLSLLTANGTVSAAYGTITFTGTDTSLNVFTVAGADFAQKNGYTTNNVVINAPAGSTVVINVTGGSLAYTYGGFNVVGVDPSNIIWNFGGLGSASITGIDWRGSILAPNTTISTVGGQFHGQLVANTLSATWTLFHNDATFTSDVLGRINQPPVNESPVPEPSTALMLFGGLGAVAFGVYRKRQS